MQLTTEERIKRAHIQLMKHPETALFSGVMMMGETSVSDDKITAYTDGVNKRYGRQFVDKLKDAEVNGLVLHENLHIALRHLLHNRDLFMEDRQTANVAADYVVNDIIVSLKDKTIAVLPEGGLHDEKYHNMNMRDIYRLLKKQKEEEEKQGRSRDKSEGSGDKNGDGSPAPGNGEYQFDEHDVDSTAPQNAEDAKALDDRIDRALREGAVLAGRLGGSVSRVISDLLTPKTRWQDELRDFVSSTMLGKDEYTWKKFNRRQLPNDLYLPSVENETIGEIVVAIDTSGSIGPVQLSEFATEITSICDTVSPEKVRVLWWDTMVHGEQIFEGSYDGLAHMLRPMGGGGTRVSCVADYINAKSINAECVIVFTDGYVESSPKWSISSPTLWLVTENKRWMPPVGRKVVFEQ